MNGHHVWNGGTCQRQGPFDDLIDAMDAGRSWMEAGAPVVVALVEDDVVITSWSFRPEGLIGDPSLEGTAMDRIDTMLTKVKGDRTRPPRPSAATVVVDEEDRILMLQRDANAVTGPGRWSIPGGKLDAGETLMKCAGRELFEETGLVASDMVRLAVITEDMAWGEDLHFISHYYLVKAWTGTPVVVEPAKHAAMEWFSMRRIEDLVETPDPDFPIFEPLMQFVTNGGMDEVRAMIAEMRKPIPDPK